MGAAAAGTGRPFANGGASMQIQGVISETEHVGPYRWKDFLALDEDDNRELIDGYLIEIDVTNLIHEWIVLRLGAFLLNWAMPRRAGVVLASNYGVRISDTRGVLPDVQFFRSGGRPVPHDALEDGAPDVAIEVVSPSSGTYDRGKKLRWYESIGTAEYWIVDPQRRTLDRYVLEGGRFRDPQTFRDADLFEPFEGLTVPLAELWELPSWFKR
jgi:Uma2 family endonuclease